MQIDKVVVGNLETNCYILDIDNKVLVVDPGDDFDNINNVIGGRNVLGVLITHKHFDHIGALDSFKNVNIYSFDNLKEKEYKMDKFVFDVIFNPGHSSDSVSYYFKNDNVLFCGDFIFYHNIGRCDLPTGDMNKMLESIEKIKKLPLGMIIYPGHGIETSLEEEINNNYYFK